MTLLEVLVTCMYEGKSEIVFYSFIYGYTQTHTNTLTTNTTKLCYGWQGVLIYNQKMKQFIKMFFCEIKPFVWNPFIFG